MKKSICRMAAVLASATALSALTGPAFAANDQAGVQLVPPAAHTGAVAPSQQASTIREPKKVGGQTLRCWQQGRLLFESEGFRADVERQPNAVKIPRVEGDPVIVLDNKDSICILSSK